MIGKTVSHYKILEKLAEGAMGVEAGPLKLDAALKIAAQTGAGASI